MNHAGHAFAQQFQLIELLLNVLADAEVWIRRLADPARVLSVHRVVERGAGLLQLRMSSHYVVALHEGLHRDFPIGGQDGRVPPFRAHLAHAVRLEPIGHGPDAFAEGGRVVVEIDECAAAPQFHAALLEREVRLVQLSLAEQVLAVDEGILAVHVETPTVEWADEALRLAIAVAMGQRHAAVTTGVVKRLHALPGPDDDDGLVEDLVFDPIADIRDLLQAARHLPDMRPQALALELVEFLVEVARGRDALRIRDSKWDRRRGSGFQLCHRGHLRAPALVTGMLAETGFLPETGCVRPVAPTYAKPTMPPPHSKQYGRRQGSSICPGESRHDHRSHTRQAAYRRHRAR